MPREIVREEEASLPKVKMLLEQRMKEGELSDFQKRTYDYATKFSKLSAEKADGLLKRLKDDGISPFIATQIVNIMPESVDELRMIFMAESKPMIPSELEKILTVVSTFRG
jgi:DNA-directed RNA polymerase subunit F